MRDILERQRAAFVAELPVTVAARKDRLRRAIAMLKDNADAFCDALNEDFGGRSRDQSMATDIMAPVGAIKHALAHVDRWMRPEARKVQFPLGLLGARARVEFQPKGVVGVIAPWNFPVQLVMGPIAGALAAGNRVMAKSSEYTPRVAALFEAVAPKYFAIEEVTFVSGGPEIGKAFSELPFDHLIFTGATGIGRHILHAAADNLVPVTLELGGKSPTIIGRSADMARATERIALGKMLNAGQICLAPDYLYVPDDRVGDAVAGLKHAVAGMYPTLRDNPDYAAVINDRHHARLTAHLDDARAKGAELVEINPAGENFNATNSRKLPLTLVLDPTDEMTVMQEEIFGPILPVKRYRRLDEAVDYVNRHDRPLGLYYFGSDRAEERALLDRTISGGVTVNDVIFHVSMEDLPFGGVGPSGMGNYHGQDGFRTFSHAKAIYRQPRIDVAKLAGLKPPYGAALRRTVAREMK